MIYWPSDLPSPLFGTMYQPADPQLRSSMQDGFSYSRRNFTAVPVAFSARWIFKTDAHAAMFEDFYKNDAADGTLWFKMSLLLPQGRGERIVRFAGIYSGPKRVNPPGRTNGAWEYSAPMEIYLRPGDLEPPDKTPIPAGDFILLEDGDYILMEDGSRILLE